MNISKKKTKQHLKNMEIKKLSTFNLYPAKVSAKSQSKIRTSSEIQTQQGFMTSTPTLSEILKEVF